MSLGKGQHSRTKTMSSSSPKPPSSTSASSKPLKPPASSPSLNPTPNLHHNPKASIVYHHSHALSRATFLTWSQLLWRRARRLKQLSKCYRHHYWAMMEDLKARYREYYWEYGVSPSKEQPRQIEDKDSGGDDNKNNNNGAVEGCGESVELKHNHRCLFVGCKLKAMALTSFCHLHILSDSKQKLYKPCDYMIKSAQAGPITCGKPILRSTVPSLCTVHFQKAQKHVTRALKKAGLNVSSSTKLAPKFHVIVAEYVHQIQAKRRNALKNNKSEVMVKEEIAR